MADITVSQIAVTLSASLLSGLVALGLSTWHYRRYERRRVKYDTFKKFLANRYDLKGDEFSRALNEIFLVFNDSSKVTSALSQFHEKTTHRQPSEDALIALFKAMCADLGISHTEFNDSFFLRPFNTRPSSSAP